MADKPMDTLRSLPFQERLALMPELLGIEPQLILHTMGEPGPVRYFLCDLTSDAQ